MPKITARGGATNRQAELRSNDEPPELKPEPRVQTLDISYDTWTRKELQAELRRRGLPVSGNKDQQVARLKANEPEG